MKERLVDIAISGPLRRTFTYRLRDSMETPLPGQRVLVPFGRKNTVGFYLGPTTAPKEMEIKEAIRFFDESTYVSKELFQLCRWIADYYFANPADVLTSALAPSLKKQERPHLVWSTSSHELASPEIAALVKPGKRLSAAARKSIERNTRFTIRNLIGKGILVEEWQLSDARPRTEQIASAGNLGSWQSFFSRRKTNLAPFDGSRTNDELKAAGWKPDVIAAARERGILTFADREVNQRASKSVTGRVGAVDISPTDEQQAVCDAFLAEADRGFSTHLLHGVTGSGKTLVYCRITQTMVAQGKGVLILTPEIALTATALAWFRGFFGDAATVIHSAMTDSERMDSWLGIRSGKYPIVIGPRSALFAPVCNLGCIIVDEEHDGSYKQNDPSPRFHGRDAAIMRSKIHGIPVLLGSASPSLESYRNATAGRYRLHKLTKRPGNAVLPTIRVVDMRTERVEGEMKQFSLPVIQAVRETLDRKEQAIVFLNRRGYAIQLACEECGEIATCRNCKIALTFHKSSKRLQCHYCGHSERGWIDCPKCQSHRLILSGSGTQKIEEQLPALFPSARVARLDSDSAGGRDKAHAIIGRIASGECNLLVGTQMVTKGLDLPAVTLVAVLSADQSLNMPDFRAAERTFARLVQVAGRSGRAERRGEVLIQTYNPSAAVIEAAAAQDFESFYRMEIASREALHYPPFSRLIRIVFEDPDEKRVVSSGRAFADSLSSRVEKSRVPATLIGPAPCPMSFVRGRHRRNLFVKTSRIVEFTKLLTEWENQTSRFGMPSATKIVVDVDPDDMM
jgi:primosomal protein N' (replication factor Y) (superfamily II helicase)